MPNGFDFDIPIEVKYLDGRYEKLGVRIRRVSPGFYRLWSPVAMGLDRPLTIFYCGNRIEGTVLYSNRAPEGGFNVGVNCGAPDLSKRREQRVPARARAVMMHSSAPEPIQIRVTDVSQYGFGFSSPVQVPLGAAICMEFQDCVIFAEVRHCSRVGARYHAGCQIEQFIRIQHAGRSRSVLSKLKDRVFRMLGKRTGPLHSMTSMSAR